MSSGDEPAAASPPSGPSVGSGSATIDPSIESGAGSRVRPSAAATAGPAAERQLVVPGHDRRPAAVEQRRRRLEGRGHGEPGVGSSVPCQSNSARNRAVAASPRRVRAVARSCSAGSRPAGRAGRGGTPAPFGAQTHLWRLPVYQAAPSASRSSGSMPGRVRAVDERLDPALGERARRSARSGSTSAVGLVTWLTSASRVRSVTAAEDRVDDVVRPTRPGTGSGRRRRGRRRARRRGAGR